MNQTPSDRLSSHLDALRPPSSTSTRQRWSTQPSSSASASHHPVNETASPSSSLQSQEVKPCRYDPASSTLDESTLAYRISALRHLNGSSFKPWSWKTRQAPAATSGKSSSLASQPVLVRSYSGGADDNSASPKMPTGRSFLFGGSSPSNSDQKRRKEPQLPSDEEFSIDGILRAIEPNIRGTLDSIGEICGRSKLSLANEYGSHIAPLGEIRAPPGGLLPVEEANSVQERYSGENVVIYDDDNGDGRDHPFSSYTFFDALLPPISAPQQAAHASDSDRSEQHGDEQGIDPLPSPTTREFASKPKAGGRALLATTEPADDERVQNILTPALVSEILLDAQANGNLKEHLNDQLPQVANTDAETNGRWSDPSKPSDVQSLFRWLKQAAWSDSCGSEQQTAESRLRAMLERQNLNEQTA
ncbi:uncharacterized protein BDV14DRAFT_77562 [Aspergillus stella-maris]|uniref:uncharacterized protein n=1 Tax=Aspergillus stella-maris TaxID=1810926 RepID=UPI003CCD8DA0